MITVTRPGIKDLYLTLCPNINEDFSSILGRLNSLLQTQNAQVVKFDIFASNQEFNKNKELLNTLDYPVTWVEGKPCLENQIAGIQVHAVSGPRVKTLFCESKPLARVFEDDYAKYCALGNILPKNPFAPKQEQAQDVLEKIEKTLSLEKMGVCDIVRTWFYNKDIAAWYDKFNDVRTTFFKQKGIIDRWLPASTGIGGENPVHAVLVVGALAIQTKKKNVIIQEVSSPMQPPAPEYGSSFSRALEITMPDYKYLFISGTASIDSHGSTVHIGDVNKQFTLTMEVVGSILLSKGMNFANVVRATAYFKHDKDVAAFNEYNNCKKPFIPMVITHNDICRDNLLFEIEVDAIAKTSEFDTSFSPAITNFFPDIGIH